MKYLKLFEEFGMEEIEVSQDEISKVFLLNVFGDIYIGTTTDRFKIFPNDSVLNINQLRTGGANASAYSDDKILGAVNNWVKMYQGGEGSGKALYSDLKWKILGEVTKRDADSVRKQIAYDLAKSGINIFNGVPKKDMRISKEVMSGLLGKEYNLPEGINDGWETKKINIEEITPEARLAKKMAASSPLKRDGNGKSYIDFRRYGLSKANCLITPDGKVYIPEWFVKTNPEFEEIVMMNERPATKGNTDKVLLKSRGAQLKF